MRISLDDTGNYPDAVSKEGAHDADYDAVMEVLRNAPQEEGKLPRLKYPELTWELYTPVEDDELTAEETVEILMGGEA